MCLVVCVPSPSLSCQHFWYKGTYRTAVSNSSLNANNNQFSIAGMGGERFTHLPKPSGWHTHKAHILNVPAETWLLSLSSFCIQIYRKYSQNLFFYLKHLLVFIALCLLDLLTKWQQWKEHVYFLVQEGCNANDWMWREFYEKMSVPKELPWVEIHRTSCWTKNKKSFFLLRSNTHLLGCYISNLV